ncbi:MAG: hypothetical protein MUD14_23410 [Hydrococcus sp. Prado102]|jgi:hypothetical protein|nr:hypothetical protein [Hydrococcus sp. Prado102]
MMERELPRNNPAKRLLEILQKASQSPKNEQISEVLGTVIQIEKNNYSFYHGFIHLFYLLDCIEKNIKYFSKIKFNNYQKLLQDIREKLTLVGIQGFQEKKDVWASVNELNNPNWIDLNFLENCAEDLEDNKIFLGLEILSEIATELAMWRIEIETSNISEEFKCLLLDKLQDPIDAVENHYAYGSAGLKKEIEAGMTKIALVEDEIATPQEKSFFVEKYYTLFKRIELFLQLKIKIKGLLPVGLVEPTSEDLHPWRQFGTLDRNCS